MASTSPPRPCSWQDLPEAIQCHILALVPLSRAKLSLRCVDNSFRNALRAPASYSTATWDEDGSLVLWGRVPASVLAPLCALKLYGAAPYTLAMLPVGLTLLEICVPHISLLQTCPQLQHLTHLKLQARASAIPLPVQKFPALEYFEIAAAGKSNLGKDDLCRVMRDLAQLSSLKRVKYACPGDGFLSLRLPTDCTTSATAFYWTIVDPTTGALNPKLAQPDSLVCQHLAEVEIVVASDHLPLIQSHHLPWPHHVVELGSFRHCHRLQRLTIRASLRNHWMIQGRMIFIPHSLKVLEVQWMKGYSAPLYERAHAEYLEEFFEFGKTTSYKLRLMVPSDFLEGAAVV